MPSPDGGHAGVSARRSNARVSLGLFATLALLTPGSPGAVTSRPGSPAQPDPCVKPANRIVAENCRPGNPSTEWDVNGAGDPEMQGFATDTDVWSLDTRVLPGAGSLELLSRAVDDSGNVEGATRLRVATSPASSGRR